ncbi:hypothetical protein LENED_001354 [Lentinula edodes]|uniref:Uncharacterized protein n=1 Tax=Lentinula edodes TaxID=5353 RepID=A0A1Q3DY51_LENED|nr:hypothetical protein LENED_001354 [Lentinula edodes]
MVITLRPVRLFSVEYNSSVEHIVAAKYSFGLANLSARSPPYHLLPHSCKKVRDFLSRNKPCICQSKYLQFGGYCCLSLSATTTPPSR